MSLQVWLPLNGNLNNQGLSNVTITNNGATVNNNGKIGKCYYFNGTNAWIKISLPSHMNSLKNTSIAMWVKGNRSFGGISHDGNVLACCTCFGASWQFVNSSWKYFNGGTNVTDGNWHHVCCTIDNDIITTYCDGIKISSNSISANNILTDLNSSHFIELGCDHPGGDEYGNVYINDFRVYDHCLSLKEVKEISKGLVLHYPLNQPERSVNLLKNGDKKIILTKSTNTSSNIFTEKISGYVDLSKVKYGATYTLSFDAWCSSDSPTGKLYFDAWGDNWNGSWDWITRTITSTKTRYKYTAPLTTKAGILDSSLCFRFLVSSMQTDSKQIFIENIKFEEGEQATSWTPNPEDENNWGLIEYDTSGFGNHASAEYYVNENMISNTTFANGTTGWAGVNGSTISLTTIDGRKCITATKGTSDFLYCTNSNITYTKGASKKCWFSAEIYSSVEQTIQAGTWVTNDTGNWMSTGYFTFTNANLKVGWNNVSAYVNLYNTNYGGRVIFAVGCSGGDNIQMYHPKLEEYNLTEYTANSSEAEFKKPLPNIGWSNNSPRYGGSYVFTDSCTRGIRREPLKFINNPGFTFSCWAYPTSYERTNGGSKTANIQFIMSQGRDWFASSTGYYHGCTIAMNGSSKRMVTYLGNVCVDSGVTLSLNTWYHLCIIYDGANLKQYINGELKKTSAIDSSYLEWGNAHAFILGKMAYSYNVGYCYHPFVGNISDARVYVTPLSAPDIKELYNSPISVTKNGTLMTQGEVIES